MIRILELWSLAVCECGYIYYTKEAAFTILTVQVSVARPCLAGAGVAA